MNPLQELALQRLRELQRDNRRFRWAYLGGALFTIVLALITRRWWVLATAAFFLVLWALNETTIRRCDRELQRWER